MEFDPILLLLVIVALGLIFVAPTIEGLEQKGPYSTRPVVPISMAGTWPSPWLYPTTIDSTDQHDHPRPFATDTDCNRIAGNLASVECADPDGNPIA